MHRIFAALPVPGGIADRLEPLRSDLHGARWRQRHHYHITLFFYGDVQRDIAEEVAAALEPLRHPILELEISGVGWFGRREPRALYARIAENAALNALAHDCRKVAAKLGLKLPKEPFLPHITLAYCNQTPVAAARAWSEQFQILKTEVFYADRFHLFESFTHSKKQSQYVPQADYELGA